MSCLSFPSFDYAYVRKALMCSFLSGSVTAINVRFVYIWPAGLLIKYVNCSSPSNDPIGQIFRETCYQAFTNVVLFTGSFNSHSSWWCVSLETSCRIEEFSQSYYNFQSTSFSFHFTSHGCNRCECLATPHFYTFCYGVDLRDYISFAAWSVATARNAIR